MEYKSVVQMTEQFGISDRRVRILCQQGKIDSVIRKGRDWLIPADAEKPIDGRTTLVISGTIARMRNYLPG